MYIYMYYVLLILGGGMVFKFSDNGIYIKYKVIWD